MKEFIESLQSSPESFPLLHAIQNTAKDTSVLNKLVENGILLIMISRVENAVETSDGFELKNLVETYKVLPVNTYERVKSIGRAWGKSLKKAAVRFGEEHGNTSFSQPCNTDRNPQSLNYEN